MASHLFKPEDLQTAVHAALVTWGKPAETDLDLLAQLHLVKNEIAEEDSLLPLNWRRAIDRMLMAGLQILQAQDEVGANVLTARFIDGKITRQVAQEMHASPDQVNRWQRAAIAQLTQILHQQESALRHSLVQSLAARLPPAPYSKLFGFTSERHHLNTQLVSTNSPWIIAITGIGGIGKTSLADYAVRAVLDSGVYEQVYWVRVDQQLLSGAPLSPEKAYSLLLASLVEQLWPDKHSGDISSRQALLVRQKLQTVPHLIVIDNLETANHTDYFGQRLAEFTNPTTFLLTSRARPSGQTAVYTYTLSELTPAESTALLRHHANAIGLLDLATATDDLLATVFAVTGGNPLALKLVASLAAVLPLPQILADLSRSRAGPITELYRHIYWQAWCTLTPAAQTLLQAMPLVATSGALPEQIQAISGLEGDSLWPALQELTSRSLLEVQGSLEERRYGIHRLTETFLRTEIIHWPQNA